MSGGARLPEGARLVLTLTVAGLLSGLAIVGAFELTLPAIQANQAAALRRRLGKGIEEAAGSLRVSFRPDVATDRIVFRLWPNSPLYAARGARLTVGAVTAAGGRVATSRPDPTMLVVERAVAAGEEATVGIDTPEDLERARQMLSR